MRPAYAVPLKVLAAVAAGVLGVAVIVLFCTFVLVMLPLMGCAAAATSLYHAVLNAPSGHLDNTSLFTQMRISRTARRRKAIAAVPPEAQPPIESVPRTRTVELS